MQMHVIYAESESVVMIAVKGSRRVRTVDQLGSEVKASAQNTNVIIKQQNCVKVFSYKTIDIWKYRVDEILSSKYFLQI